MRVLNPAFIKTRLRDNWEAATPEERTAAASWYPAIARRACALDTELRYPCGAVLDAMAVLSPRVRVSTNLLDLDVVLHADDPLPYVAAFPDNVGKAQRILNGASLAEVTTERSTKSRAFAANLRGSTRDVTIDTWMLQVMLNQTPSLSIHCYHVLADLVREVADEYGVEPRTFQAAVWIHARRKAN